MIQNLIFYNIIIEKDKPKRIWDGLTGKYFGFPILIAGDGYATKD